MQQGVPNGRRPTAREMLGMMLSSEANKSAVAAARLKATLKTPLGGEGGEGGAKRPILTSNWRDKSGGPCLEALGTFGQGSSSCGPIVVLQEPKQDSTVRCEVEISVEGQEAFQLLTLFFMSSARKAEIYVDDEYNCTLSGSNSDSLVLGGDGVALHKFSFTGHELNPIGALRIRFLSLQNKGCVELANISLQGLGRDGEEGSQRGAESGPFLTPQRDSASMLILQQSISAMAAAFEKQISGLGDKIDCLDSKLERLDQRLSSERSTPHNNVASNSVAARLDSVSEKLVKLENDVQALLPRK